MILENRMRRTLALCCALALLAGGALRPTATAQPAPSSAQAGATAAVAGQYLVRFEAGTTDDQRAALVEAQGGRLLRSLPALDSALVEFPELVAGPADAGGARLTSTLLSQAEVGLVEPNYTYTLSEVYTPNDPLLSQQYAWDLIEAPRGWGRTRGSPGVVIALVDSGAQPDHPDLSSRLVAGYDVLEGGSATEDVIGHGTHVAGTAAAATDNGAGGAGACPDCRLMPIRAFNAAGVATLSDIAESIVYAVDHGAKVINLSLGGPGASTLATAVSYAWSKGAFLSCAAGNSGTSDQTQAYPAAYEACFAVAATDADDARARFSNYGTWVEVAAPGDDILSTYKDSSYRVLSGTSMAAPHVAGLAGLLASQGLNNQQIRDRICATADPITGTGTSWRCGRINLGRALDGADSAEISPRLYVPFVAR